MIREEDKTEWFKFLAHAFAIVVCVLIASAFCLMPRWFSMSKQGIRSLIYCLLICDVIWSAVVIKILHVTGVFNG